MYNQRTQSPQFPYRIIIPPQIEKRIVSEETEIRIPNKAAFSIVTFVSMILFVIITSGRIFVFWAPALAFSGTSFVALVLWAKPKSWRGLGFIVVVSIAVFIPLFFFFDFWFWKYSILYDLLVEIGVGIIVGFGVATYFHVLNTANPNWPPPYYFQQATKKESEELSIFGRGPLMIDDQTTSGIPETQQLGQ